MTLSHLVTGAEAESFLVDPPETRWQTLEPEQLSYGHDPGSWRCGGHSGAHAFQRHLLSHLGGSLLVRALKHSECLRYIMRNKERQSFSCFLYTSVWLKTNKKPFFYIVFFHVLEFTSHGTDIFLST